MRGPRRGPRNGPRNLGGKRAGGAPGLAVEVKSGSACNCLAERTKDFEVAAWLLELLVRLDGLAGLLGGRSC